jgi:hypothetical protein
MTGRVIAGRYQLDEPIGRGAMGVVWRARDELLDREVAVKEVVISEALSDSERTNAYQRTLREARTAARLSHRGLVTVYDVAEEDGRPWIIMELVQARSLDQILSASGPLSARRAGQMAQQLLAALATAHAAGVMHRDVKPSNVLLGSDGRAVLTDFGIATFEGDPRLTQTGMVMGSPGYTAPERIRGGPATAASDLWSLGATLFTAVEGHGPFEQRGGAITTMSAIIHEDAPASPAAGPLARVIAALLRRDPSARPDALTASRQIAGLLPVLADDHRTDTALTEGPVATSQAAAGAVADAPGAESPRRGTAGIHTGMSLDAAATGTDRPAKSATAAFTASAQPNPATQQNYYAQQGPDPRQEPTSAAAEYLPMPARKRTGIGRRIAMAVIALVVVGAAGATAAVLLHPHHPHPSGTTTDRYVPLHPTGALAALDHYNPTLPPGFVSAEVPPAISGTNAGFTIAGPPSWPFVHLGGLIWRLYSPDHESFMHVELTQHTFADMLKEVTYIRDTAFHKDSFPGYKQIALRRAVIRGVPGAMWEFTWLDSNGVRLQGEDLLFIKQTAAGPQSYALFLVAPAQNWPQVLPTFEQELSTFDTVTTS